VRDGDPTKENHFKAQQEIGERMRRVDHTLTNKSGFGITGTARLNLPLISGT
jgi:hypothetical protein